MPKRTVHKLEKFPARELNLYGIAAHENDYRLSWALNEILQIELSRKPEFVVEDKKNDTSKSFNQYSFHHEETGLIYQLIANVSSYGYLLPSHKMIDFIFVVQYEADNAPPDNLLQKIKGSDIILSAFALPVTLAKKMLLPRI